MATQYLIDGQFRVPTTSTTRTRSELIDRLPIQDQFQFRDQAVRQTNTGLRNTIDRVTATNPTPSTGGGGSGLSRAVSRAAAPALENSPALSAFQMDEINAALDAINARFGFEGQALGNERGGIERAFERLRAELAETQDQAQSELSSRAGGSGRIFSGFFLNDQARLADDFADQEERALAERNARLAPILQALGSLDARQEAARALEARTIAREMVGTQEAIAAALGLV